MKLRKGNWQPCDVKSVKLDCCSCTTHGVLLDIGCAQQHYQHFYQMMKISTILASCHIVINVFLPTRSILTVKHLSDTLFHFDEQKCPYNILSGGGKEIPGPKTTSKPNQLESPVYFKIWKKTIQWTCSRTLHAAYSCSMVFSTLDTWL